MSTFRLSRLVAGAAVIAVTAACADEGPTAAGPDVSPIGVAAFVPPSGGPGDPDPTVGGKTGGAPDVERFEVCKRWEGTPGVATFSVDDGTTNNTTSTDDGTWVSGISARGFDDWTCRDVYLQGAAGLIVTVTETDAGSGYTLTDVAAETLPGGSATVGSDFVSGLVAGNPNAGVTAFFTNTEDPVEIAEGRMTGGGVKAYGIDADGNEVRVTLGLTLHCDNTLSNNLEVNWPHRQRWHIEKESLTSVVCSLIDDPTPPVAPISRFEATAVGRLNGGDFDSLIEFVFEDLGEPGRNDRIQLKIYPGLDNTEDPVLTVDTQTLAVGNFQMHYDQPHGQKPNR